MKTSKSDLILAFDKKSARHVDAQGFLHVEACNISKACVNPYWGKEVPDHEALGLDPKKIYQIFRDPTELAKAASTFNGLPLMDFHQEVNADNLEDSEVREKVVGATGTTARFEDPYLINDLVIHVAGAIEGVMSKEQTELSCAYRYTVDMTPGNFNGVAYDGRMTNIEGNHVALVDEGRAGPDVLVRDQKPKSYAQLVRSAMAAQPLTVMDKIKKALNIEPSGEVEDAPYEIAEKMAEESGKVAEKDKTKDSFQKASELYAKAAEEHRRAGFIEQAQYHNRMSKYYKIRGEKITTGDVIVKQPGHKNSKGESAPFVIKSEATGKTLWSGSTKLDAKKNLARIKSFAKDRKSVTIDVDE